MTQLSAVLELNPKVKRSALHMLRRSLVLIRSLLLLKLRVIEGLLRRLTVAECHSTHHTKHLTSYSKAQQQHWLQTAALAVSVPPSQAQPCVCAATRSPPVSLRPAQQLSASTSAAPPRAGARARAGAGRLTCQGRPWLIHISSYMLPQELRQCPSNAKCDKVSGKIMRIESPS